MTMVFDRSEEEAENTAAAHAVDFLACCIETPAKAARGVATAVTLAALVITLLASVMGTVAGLGLAAFYAGSCWSLSLYLASQERKD